MSPAAIMDHGRILLVPIQPTSLTLVAIFSVLLALFGSAGFYGIFAQLFLQIWVVKYCYVLVEHVADGRFDPPVMSTEMLSPFETRPWVQLAIVLAGTSACVSLGGTAGLALGVVLLALLPASIAVLGLGEPAWQAVNPVMLLRIVRGMGPYYLLLLAVMPLYFGLLVWLADLEVWRIVGYAVAMICQLSFFSLVGGCLYLRRHQLGFEPSVSPERQAAREEAQRIKLRAKMLDEVFEQVRLGKHVTATRPLAAWFGELDGATAALDAQYIIGQALKWQMPAGLDTLGSTIIRHLLRAGRPDAALQAFERLRAGAPTLMLDSADDLRTLIEFAESSGREELAAVMRLETPVYQPRPREPA